MILNIVFLVIGLVLILWGANALTDGASAIAKRFGISDLVIGLTVVAFGTSTPELAISVISAINGSGGLAIGNVVGSNIFNILVIVGITAMLRPIKVEKDVMTGQIPLVVLSGVVLLIMGSGSVLEGSNTNVLSRIDGLLLLIFFIIFMRYTFAQAKADKNLPNPDAQTAEADTKPSKEKKLWVNILLVIGGLAALVYGGDRFVDGASGIAKNFGVSEAVIGLTIVAAGTSLPELATSIVSALKGKTGIAVGNVIGSNIFNIFMVLGCSATIRPLAFGSIGIVDLLVLTGACLLFWVFGWFFGTRTFTRWEGAILFACYIGYTAWLLSNV